MYNLTDRGGRSFDFEKFRPFFFKAVVEKERNFTASRGNNQAALN
jgi:hypothetical protein